MQKYTFGLFEIFAGYYVDDAMQVAAGTKGVKIGQLVALTVDTQGETPVIPKEEGAATPAPQATAAASTTQAAGKVGSTQPLSPAVRSLVDTHHLTPANIPATGRNGRILKRFVPSVRVQMHVNYGLPSDVLDFLAKNPAPAAAPIAVTKPTSAPKPVTQQQTAAKTAAAPPTNTTAAKPGTEGK